MRYDEFRPAEDLRPYVDRYWSFGGDGSGAPECILPDGHSELVVHLGSRPRRDGVLQGSCLFVGQMRSAVVLTVSGRIDTWGIRFRPFGARAFCGADQRALANEIHDAGCIWGSAAERLRQQLGDCADRRAATDAWLRSELRFPGSSRVARATSLLSGFSVESVADRLGTSRRQLERTFASEVGLSPQTYKRIARIQFALRLRRVRPDWTWAAIAAEVGCSDQSHLALDFRAFAGSAPMAVMAGLAEMGTALIRS